MISLKPSKTPQKRLRTVNPTPSTGMRFGIRSANSTNSSRPTTKTPTWSPTTHSPTTTPMSNPTTHSPTTDKLIYLNCPHCNGLVELSEKTLNCRIFRHATYKSNGKQIPPHAKKELCERLKREGKVYGCAGPYKVIENGSGYEAVICDYI